MNIVTTNITLNSNPSNAPGCILIEHNDGRDLLIQTDWDWPAIASVFGWSVSEVQKPAPDCYSRWQTGGSVTRAENAACLRFENSTCDHSGTDGTINCPDCKITAHEFIQAARQWIDDNDGATAEDPGYFES